SPNTHKLTANACIALCSSTNTASFSSARTVFTSLIPESKTTEECVFDALDLMVKTRWGKKYGQNTKGIRVDLNDHGKLTMDALGYVIEDLGPESLNQQLWWAVGTLAAVHMMPRFAFTMRLGTASGRPAFCVY